MRRPRNPFQIVNLVRGVFIAQLFAQPGKVGAELKANQIAFWFNEPPGDLDSFITTRVEYLADSTFHDFIGSAYLNDTSYFDAPDFEHDLLVYGVSFWKFGKKIYHIKTNKVLVKKEAQEPPVAEPTEFWHKQYGGQLQIYSELGFEVILFDKMGIVLFYKGYGEGEVWIDIPVGADFGSLFFKTSLGYEIVSLNF